MKVNRTGRRVGFTLIELLVVIGIIVLLMAILIPALTAAKKQGYTVQTTALLNGLRSNIEVYSSAFSNQYPGPVPESLVGAASKTAGTPSGTQNLLLGLTFAMTPSATMTGGVMVVKTNVTDTQLYASGSLTATIPSATPNASSPNSPIDYANLVFKGATPAADVYRQTTAFYSPSKAELSAAKTGTTWDVGGVAGCSSAQMAFPTILDRYPDQLPILYYRRVQGVDSAVSVDAGTAGGYYLASNKEYTSSTGMVSPSGTALSQGSSPLSGATAAQATELQKLINPGNTTQSVGGFVLISAGSGRVYGKTNDTIVVVGGQ